MSEGSKTLAPTELRALRAEFDGRVIGPGDALYDGLRIDYHGRNDRHPGAIVRPANANEVARLVTLARDSGLPLAVRSGGHSGHSTCHGGLVVDLSGMRGIEIDAANRTAWAQTGLTAGEYTAATGEHGLATGFGDTASVGIGGITLGGGVGFLARKHGLTIDSLVAAELVTADGEVFHVDADSHPDLFWAIRGGGGNFGVVTRLCFRLHEVATVLGGLLILPATPSTVASFVAVADAAPEELTTTIDVMLAPPLPFVPEEAHGSPVILAGVCYAGSVADGEQAVAPLRRLAPAVVDAIEPIPYAGMYFPEEEEKFLAEVHSTFVDSISEDAAAMILERLQSSTAMMASASLRVLGGAVERVDPDATAYAHRNHRIMANPLAVYVDPDEAEQHRSWVSELGQELGGSGAYVNFLGDEGPSRLRDAYPGETWTRLAAVKSEYDPTNLFRLNHNIPPAP